MKISSFYLTFLGLLLFSQCTSPVKQPSSSLGSNTETGQASLAPSYNNPTVAPPFQGVDVPFTTFQVKGSGAQSFRTESGTEIEVPANAFVDAQGNAVKDVTLHYREFHDAAAIVASGIPMHNPETGEYMQTAGMFELNGTDANGQEVRIKEGQPLQVNLASFVAGDEYNFFSLDQKNGRWTDLGSNKPVINESKAEAIARLNRLCPTAPSMPSRMTSDDLVFEMDVDYSQFPELKPFHGIMWEYASKDLTNSPRSKPWVFETNWTSVDIKATDEKGLYTLTLKSWDKTYMGTVKPVLKGENYDQALAGFQTKMKEFEYNKNAIEQERARLEKEANFRRSFSVNNFGMCNWDVWKNPSRLACKTHPQFDANSGYKGDYNDISYFLITQSNKSVIRFSQGDLDKFSFDPSQNNTFLAILPGNKVAVFGKEDFKNLNLGQIRSNNNVVFQMKTIEKVVTSVSDLESLLNS